MSKQGKTNPPEGTAPKQLIGTPSVANPDGFLLRIHEQVIGTAKDVQHIQSTLGDIKSSIDALGVKFDAVDSRMTKLEHWRTWILGAAAMLFLVVGGLAWFADRWLDLQEAAAKTPPPVERSGAQPPNQPPLTIKK